VLDNFISPIPRFEGDILFLTISVSAWSPSGESASDPSDRSSVRVSKTRAGKRKAAINPTLEKKAKKAMSKPTSGIKINEPAPKASPALTFPSGPQTKIPIHRSNRYTCSRLLFVLNQVVTCEPLHRVPRDINLDPSMQSFPKSGESPKADKPSSPNTEKSVPGSSKPLGPGGTQSSPGAGGAPSPSD
jgi:hypothetical protein